MKTGQGDASYRPSSAGRTPEPRLLDDLRSMISAARETVARRTDLPGAMLYWNIGRRIWEHVGGRRAAYGWTVVSALGRELGLGFGRGFSRKNLWRMIQFGQAFADEQIVVTLSRQLRWSHFVALLPIANPAQREFYAELCRVERWNVRMLRQKIAVLLIESERRA